MAARLGELEAKVAYGVGVESGLAVEAGAGVGAGAKAGARSGNEVAGASCHGIGVLERAGDGGGNLSIAENQVQVGTAQGGACAVSSEIKVLCVSLLLSSIALNG